MQRFSQLIFISAFLFLISLNVQAQPASLHELMELSGQHFSAIARAVGTPDKNPESAVNANEIRTLFVTAFGFEPDVIRNAPEAEKPALLRLYQKLVAKIVVIAADLQDSFLANDNAKAKTLLGEMAKVRQEGHTVFEHK